MKVHSHYSPESLKMARRAKKADPAQTELFDVTVKLRTGQCVPLSVGVLSGAFNPAMVRITSTGSSTSRRLQLGLKLEF